MPEKRKVTVRRPRKTSGGKISVKKHLSDEEVINVVNLKTPIASEQTAVRQSFNLEPSKDFKPSPSGSPLIVYRKLAITFILVVAVILAIVAYFAAVKLEVTIKPKVSQIKASSSFSIYDRPEDFTLPANSILGIVREMDVEYKGNYPVTSGEVTGAEVSGRVVIVNKYIKDQPLVATTRLLTPTNQLLRLKDTVVVPAGGSVEVEVYGESADPSFTLADTRLTIPGLWAGLQDKIYAEAKAGAVSYREKRKTVIKQEDLDRALAGAKQALVEKAVSEIETSYNDYDEKLYQLDEKAVSFSFDARVGEEKSEVNISLASKVIVVAFKKSNLINLSQTTLESGLEADQTVVNNENTSSAFKVNSADTTNNIAQVEMSVDGMASAKPDSELVDRKKIVGLTESQIRSYLDGQPNIESYELRFTPSFLKIAPQLADRITVIVK